MPQVDIDNVHLDYKCVHSTWSSLKNIYRLFYVEKKGGSTGSGNGKFRGLYFFIPTVLLFFVSILKIGSFYEGNWVFGVFIYLVTTNLCAFHVTDSLNEELSFEFDEFVVINLLLGNAALGLMYVYLTVLMPTVTGFHLLFALAIFSLATCIASTVLLKNRRTEQKLDPTRVSLQIVGLLLCFLFGFWIISKAIPLEYWRGEDPWGLAVVSRGILENSLSPLEAFNYYRSHFAIYTSGFYSYVSAILLITGYSVESVVRYGGIVIAGTLSMITYVTVKRLLNPLGGLFAATLLFMNSFMVTRLVSPLREYFSFLYLILFLLLPQLRKMESNRLHYTYIFVNGVLLSIIIISHALVIVMVMSILGYYFLQFIIKKQYTLSMELVYIILLGFILSWPYYTLIYYPFIEFLSINNINMVVIISIFSLAVFSGIILFKLNNKYDLIALFSPKVKLILLILSGLVIFINVNYPPNLGSSYEYSYINPNYFSRIIIPLTIIGLFSIAYSSAPSVILFLFILISGFTGLSYLSVQVPLSRLSIYLMWVMSAISGYVMSMVADPDNFLVIPKTIEELKMFVTKSRPFLSKNRVYFVLLVVVLFSCYKEVNDVYRRPITFNEFDVESARSFAQMVLPDDLVIHDQSLHILLYYAGVTPDNMIRSDDPWVWQSKLINASTVYEFSNIVRTEYANVKRVHFVTDYNFYNLFDEDTPLRSILQDYAEEKFVGSLLVFTLNIPFDLSMTPLPKIRFIEAVGQDPVVPNGDPGEWDQYIKNPSNVVFDSSDSDKLFKVYFSGRDAEADLVRIGAAYSKDGVQWSKIPHPLTSYGYDDPYIVSVNEKYYLYAVKTLEKNIVRLESHDGLDWCNETVVIKPGIGYDYWSYESPIVWFNGTWNMVYTETVIGDDEQKCGLVYLSSPNGLEWNIENPDMKWALQNNGIRYEYSKILLSDLILCDEGYLFFGKFEAENENRDMLWRTGSFLVYDINTPYAIFRSLNYRAFTNSSSCVDSVQIFINPTINQTLFLYSDNSKPEYSSLTAGLSLGTIGDNTGLSNTSIIIP